MTNKLQDARTYEAEQMQKVSAIERPLFHVTGAVGWINDPNGFSLYKNEYHLFFQYYPYATHWGPMHWGHVKTKDFIKWERLPIAMAPDESFDNAGCFSGSAVELEDGRQLLIYTGVTRGKNEEGFEVDFQNQCIAIGDGNDYEKVKNNPVLGPDDIPEGNSRNDFRDPKIWKDNGIYYLAVGNRTMDTSGEILLYSSIDALNWKFEEVIDKCNNEYGKMWECPDFFKLDDKYILIVSPQEMQTMGMEFHAGNGTVLFIGDAENYHNFRRQRVQTVDYGLDFYAPQTLLALDGRRIMIAWMQNWETSNCGNNDRKIYGEMTIPRVLEIKNGRVIQNPIDEIKNYYSRKVTYDNVYVAGVTSLPGINGRVIDMTVSIKAADSNGYEWFKINVAQDGEHHTYIMYEPKNRRVRIDRSLSGGRNDIVNTREFLVSPVDGLMKFRILLDRYSMELFVNDGQQAASMTFYTDLSAQSISFDTNGAVMMNLVKYDLEEKLENV